MSSGGPVGLNSRMTTTLVLPGRIARDDIQALCERARVLIEPRAGLVVCDARAMSHPNAVTVDALARLQLTAMGFGCRLSLTQACDELQALIALVGLDDVLPVTAGSGFEMVGQTEVREQVRGVEEEADIGDVAI